MLRLSFAGLFAVFLIASFDTAPAQAQGKGCGKIRKQYPITKQCRGNPGCIAENAKNREARMAAGCQAKVKQ